MAAGRDHLDALARLYNVPDRSRREGGAFALHPAALEQLHSRLVACDTATVQACATLMELGVKLVNSEADSPGFEDACANLNAFMLTMAYVDVANAWAHARRRGVPIAAVDPIAVAQAGTVAQARAFADAWNAQALAMAERGPRGR